jgi:hypothetical protein
MIRKYLPKIFEDEFIPIGRHTWGVVTDVRMDVIGGCPGG